MSTAATLAGVSMCFGAHTALTDVSTAIRDDTITGLLGRNGPARRP